MDPVITPDDEARTHRLLHAIARDIEAQMVDDDDGLPYGRRRPPRRRAPRWVVAVAAAVLVVAAVAAVAVAGDSADPGTDTGPVADRPALGEDAPEDPPGTMEQGPAPVPGAAPADQVEAVQSILGLPEVLEQEGFPDGGWRATYGDGSGGPGGEFSIGIGPGAGRDTSLRQTLLGGESTEISVDGVEVAYMRIDDANGITTISGVRDGKVLRLLLLSSRVGPDEAPAVYAAVAAVVPDF